jgi:Xaa-Pro aminopeptidase
VTRTFVVGPITKETARPFHGRRPRDAEPSERAILKGCRGSETWIFWPRPHVGTWASDYKCGTGHGVGFVLGVHEAPNGIRWRIVPEGTIPPCWSREWSPRTSRGFYIEGSHGIRTENELLCVADGATITASFFASSR